MKFQESDILESHILLFDGHLLFDVWYGMINLAKEKKVTIIKLPVNTTDLLRPLDVSCFQVTKRLLG